MVVRFVCVVCVPLCVRVSRVSRVCPGSPRCLFTGTKYMLRPPLKFHKLRPPSQAFKQHTLIEELSSNVNAHNALKLSQVLYYGLCFVYSTVQ